VALLVARWSVRLLSTGESAEATVAVKVGSLVQVEAPPPVVIIAYASHNDKAPKHKPHACMNSQMDLILPVSLCCAHMLGWCLAASRNAV
jgi:hypothetical protein